MKNTAITPTYFVEVKFSWKYPSKPLQTITKSGFVNSTSENDDEIAQTFIDTFIKNNCRNKIIKQLIKEIV